MPPSLTAPRLAVSPWVDPVIDALGYEPRSGYVERFWLPIVGPSTTWLARHLAHRLDHEPRGFTLEVAPLAAALGLGTTLGRHSPVVRALHRACQFGLARAVADDEIQVRRALPPLTRHQVERLAPSVQADHAAWQATESDAATLDAQHRRARRIALALSEIDDDVASVAARLGRYRVHPAVAFDAARWAARLRPQLTEGRSAHDGAARDDAA